MSQKIIQIIKLILFNIILTFFLLETASAILIECNIINARKPPYTMKYSTESFWEDNNEHFGVWHVNNRKFRHIRNCYDIIYSSNSYGARDIERTIMSNHPRVIVLGDSFIEGMGVERKERFTEKLEEETGIEHLNFGTSGNFGPIHEYLLYKHLAKKFEHEYIILGILPDNDFYDMNPNLYPGRYMPFLEGDYPDYLLKYSMNSVEESSWAKGKDPLNSFFLNFSYLRNIIDYVSTLKDARKQAKRINQEDNKEYSPFAQYSNKDWKMMKYAYEKIIEEAEGKKILFFTIPRFRDLMWYDKYKESPLGIEIQNWTQTYPNVHFIDLLPIMFEEVPKEEWHLLFHTCDRHWSDKGNTIAKELIYKNMNNQFY